MTPRFRAALPDGDGADRSAERGSSASSRGKAADRLIGLRFISVDAVRRYIGPEVFTHTFGSFAGYRFDGCFVPRRLTFR